MPRLVLLHGAGAGREIALAGEVVIGRAIEVECPIEDLGASRRHCRVRPEGAFWVVEDLGSRNGTYVNGQRVEQVVPVRDNDTIRVGATEFRFLAQDAGPRVAPPAAAAPARPGVTVPPVVARPPAVAQPPAVTPRVASPPQTSPASRPPPPPAIDPAPKKYDVQPKRRRAGW